MCCCAIGCQHSTLKRLFGCVFLVCRHHLRKVNKSSVHTFRRFSTIFLFLTFLNIHIYFIKLKTYDQQFTLTTKKSLHIIFKGKFSKKNIFRKDSPPHRTTSCANFVKFDWPEIGKVLRGLPDQKKQNFRKVSRSRFCADRAQNLSGTAPNNILGVPQISSKSVHFRRSYSRTREHRWNVPQSISNTREASSPSTISKHNVARLLKHCTKDNLTHQALATQVKLLKQLKKLDYIYQRYK